jgi:N-acetyl-alpha-D-muramate 1-phosphate uridylyltransferase
MLPVAILAGGLASRLQPLTRHTPKSLVMVAGRPFIFHQLELLRSQGVRRVVLCVGHLGEQIVSAVGDGRQFGLDVGYSFDGSRPLGTGGALKRAIPALGADFFVLYGDSYLPCSFATVQAAYETAHRPALMTVLRNDNRWGQSNVAVRADGSIEYNKDLGGDDPLRCASQSDQAGHIDFGLSVLSARVLQPYPEAATVDLADIWRALSCQGQLAAFEVTGRFYEIGSRAGLADTEEFLARRLETA